jgi:hypothetical protein
VEGKSLQNLTQSFWTVSVHSVTTLLCLHTYNGPVRWAAVWIGESAPVRRRVLGSPAPGPARNRDGRGLTDILLLTAISMNPGFTLFHVIVGVEMACIVAQLSSFESLVMLLTNCGIVFADQKSDNYSLGKKFIDLLLR